MAEDSAQVGAIGLALEPLAWQMSQPKPTSLCFSERVGVGARGGRERCTARCEDRVLDGPASVKMGSLYVF